MGGTVRKQYLALSGRPILAHTLAAFGACSLVERIYLVVPEDDFSHCRRHVIPQAAVKTPIRLVAGGGRRQESVRNGLAAVPAGETVVAVHDGVRPFVSPEDIGACIRSAEREGACILGIPVFETLKITDAEDTIRTTVDRRRTWLAQTPQAFRFQLIKDAHDTAHARGYRATDDAMLVERLGKPVRIITGSRLNIKITTREDLLLAEAILAARENITGAARR